jgi:mRNA interferase RelE/StbE
LKNHPLAEYRLHIGNYRVLFDVSWERQEIYILKIGHRRDVY